MTMTDKDRLKTEFHRAMLATYDRAREFGYSPILFLNMVREHGGLEAAKRLLRSGEIQQGLMRLKKEGRLDISMEALVLEERWESLFSKKELDAARWRLEQVKAGDYS